MWLQLTITTAVLCLVSHLAYPQKKQSDQGDSSSKALANKVWFEKNAFTKTEVNILSSYYQQDGNHAAVTGGFGSEALTDFTPTLVVNVPLDSSKKLTLNSGVDFYTSASTDNIDDVTSTSRRDSRAHLEANYTQLLPYRRETFSISAGFSTEYDVNSVSFGTSWSKESLDGNNEISLAAKVFLDRWSFYLPIEFRGQNVSFLDQTRRSFSLSANYSRVISKRLQATLSTDIVYQTGLLSTPFHRVFFDDGVDVSGLTARQLIRSAKLRRIERLPSQRIKVPVGLRLHYYISDRLVARLKYRFYQDDFGITASTVSADFPVKFGPFFSVIPFFRYHTQTASTYFQEFGLHVDGAAYYTSDYDLANLSSKEFGVGLRYSPLYGIARFKLPTLSRDKSKVVNFLGLDLRYGHYFRSDGLEASIISIDLSFAMQSIKKGL